MDQRQHSKWAAFSAQTIGSALDAGLLPICITDPTVPDNPIVYVNTAFTELTGYSADEAVGRNCRFLQGPDTDPEDIAALRRAVAEDSAAVTPILNYRKDGTPFYNAVQIGPIKDDTGATIYYFGSQLDITELQMREERQQRLADRELLHRLRNIINVMTVITRMTAREEGIPEELTHKLTSRLKVLGEAHFRTFQPEQGGLPLRELIETVVHAYAPLGPRQTELMGDACEIPKDLVTVLTLSLHELAINAVKHGALSRASGWVCCDWAIEQCTEHGPMLRLHWAERDGPPVVAPTRRSGSEIIERLIKGMRGTLEYNWHPDGLNAEITLPWRLSNAT